MGAGKKSYDVIILGSGITGLSTAFHLLELGIDKVKILSENSPSLFNKSMGAVTASGLDNFTRISHTYGQKFAAAYWNFLQESFDEALHHLKKFRVPISGPSQRLRLIETNEERSECEKAVDQLKRAHFNVNIEAATAGLKEVQLQQNEGFNAVYCNPEEFISSFSQLFSNISRETATSIKIESGKPTVKTQSGTTLKAEIVVVAQHLNIKKMIPELRDALIGTADQWLKLKTTDQIHLQPGTMFSIKHGYDYGVIVDENTLNWGGGRFLRPMAGIGDDFSKIDSKVTKYQLSRAKKIFGLSNLEIMSSTAGSMCRPCDELPIIGPMFGYNGRILVATGYMGLGSTLGFASGRHLAEIIATGNSPSLPRELWPERLRSLSQ